MQMPQISRQADPNVRVSDASLYLEEKHGNGLAPGRGIRSLCSRAGGFAGCGAGRAAAAVVELHEAGWGAERGAGL